MATAVIVQLPFPSTREPDPRLSKYHRDYDRLFRLTFPGYRVPRDGLWEMPRWVAQLTALVRAAGLDSTFCDLSQLPATARDSADRIQEASGPGDLILMSPLARNLGLALEVAGLLNAAGQRVVFGGNMTPLVSTGAVDLVHRGELDSTLVRQLARLAAASGGEIDHPPRRGRAAELIDWVPDYRHLDGYQGEVRPLWLNASHGCRHACSFCGDAPNRPVLVDRAALTAEVDELTRRFPDTKLIYVGDKTFGQSKAAVRNLIEVFRDRPDFQFIVQTHVRQVRPWAIDAMRELGVVAVELGSEFGDSLQLARPDKLSQSLDDHGRKIRMLADAGLKVGLNVVGGLDEETELSHRQTVEWLWDNRSWLWFLNAYNFVPHPLMPEFPRLRDRIFDWDFANWREDGPPVYRPQNLTAERSWEFFTEKVDVAHRIVREGIWAAT